MGDATAPDVANGRTVLGYPLPSAAVTLSATSVRVDRDDQTRTFARADIGAVFLDVGRLVLLDNGSRQLASERHQASGPALAQAFTRYGYPWYDSDPFADQFRPWCGA